MFEVDFHTWQATRPAALLAAGRRDGRGCVCSMTNLLRWLPAATRRALHSSRRGWKPGHLRLRDRTHIGLVSIIQATPAVKARFRAPQVWEKALNGGGNPHLLTPHLLTVRPSGAAVDAVVCLTRMETEAEAPAA